MNTVQRIYNYTVKYADALNEQYYGVIISSFSRSREVEGSSSCVDEKGA